MIDIRGMRKIFAEARAEFWVALLTALTVVFVGVEQGIILAMALSIIEHIYHSYKPFDRLIAIKPDGSAAFAALDSGTQAAPGLVIYRFGASLYYANATRFTEEIMALVEDAQPPVRWLCLAAEAIGDVDYSAADSLRAVNEELGARGVTLVLCELDDKVRRQLDAYGLTDKIGAGNLYGSAADVIAAFARLDATSAQPSDGTAPS
jgi:SulP family sulfate permease